MGLNLYFQGHSLEDLVYYGVIMNVGKIIEVFVNNIFNALIFSLEDWLMALKLRGKYESYITDITDFLLRVLPSCMMSLHGNPFHDMLNASIWPL